MFERTKNNFKKAAVIVGQLTATGIHVCKKIYTFQIVALLIVAGSIGITFTLYAAPNQAFVYQGRLTDSAYTPVSNGTYYMKLKMYSDPAGGNGNCVWATGTVTDASLSTITNNCAQSVATSVVQVTVAHGSFVIHIGDTGITGGERAGRAKLNFKKTKY